MKKLLFFILLMVSFTFVSGQKSIDALFDKYSGKDGFTTVSFNGSLLRLAGCIDSDAGDKGKQPAGIAEIRILSQDNKSLKTENFYDMVIRDIDLNNYEEFMRVKESGQDLRMLVRMEGKRFREFLLIAGGEDNAIIQIKGDLSLDDAKKISKDARKNNGLKISAENR